MNRSLLVFGLLLLNGCSFAFVDGPPSPALQQDLQERNQIAVCTTSRSWPLADAVGTAYWAWAFLDDVFQGEALFAGGITGVSAVVGFRRVAACVDYLEGEGVPLRPSPSPGLSFLSVPYPPLVRWNTVSDFRLGRVEQRLDPQHQVTTWLFHEEFREFSGVRRATRGLDEP